MNSPGIKAVSRCHHLPTVGVGLGLGLSCWTWSGVMFAPYSAFYSWILQIYRFLRPQPGTGYSRPDPQPCTATAHRHCDSQVAPFLHSSTVQPICSCEFPLRTWIRWCDSCLTLRFQTLALHSIYILRTYLIWYHNLQCICDYIGDLTIPSMLMLRINLMFE